jgi:hypothetical protein
MSKGQVVRETFKAAGEGECSARLYQLMNAGGPRRIFAGCQARPDGSMVPCQAGPSSSAESAADWCRGLSLATWQSTRRCLS